MLHSRREAIFSTANRSLYLVLILFYVSITALTIIFFGGNGDSGDSVLHYLFARYAPSHPELYFDHWAKPFYVLLASPFAQFGFVGIKVFNGVVMILTMVFTIKTTERLGIVNSLIGGLIFIFSPLCFVLTFSGLTEPLFALLLISSVYFVIDDKVILGSVLVSLLPFVRSEGLIIVVVFGCYFLLQRIWRAIPWLIFGHLLYAIAGSWIFGVYDSLFWVFNKIPYAKLSSTYGSGSLFHFVEQLNFVVGLPIYILFWIGVLRLFWRFKVSQFDPRTYVLIFLGFWAFLIAHSLFWYLGIFNSMGLIRVLIGVLPLISIIALIGFNLAGDQSVVKNRLVICGLQILLIGGVLVFPFTNNIAAIDIRADLDVSKRQRLISQVADFVLHKALNNQRYYYVHPYLSDVLEIDHFDDQVRRNFAPNFFNDLRTGDIIIWDNWFAEKEFGLGQRVLDSNSTIECVYEAKTVVKGREEIILVYRVL